MNESMLTLHVTMEEWARLQGPGSASDPVWRERWEGVLGRETVGRMVAEGAELSVHVADAIPEERFTWEPVNEKLNRLREHGTL